MTTLYGERPGLTPLPLLKPCRCCKRLTRGAGNTDLCDVCYSEWVDACDLATDDAVDRAIAAKHGVTL